jgi:hypothetical protein
MQADWKGHRCYADPENLMGESNGSNNKAEVVIPMT